MDRKDLKIQALLEKISSLTTEYENQCADYRVHITMLNNEVEELKERASKPDTTPEETFEDVESKAV